MEKGTPYIYIYIYMEGALAVLESLQIQVCKSKDAFSFSSQMIDTLHYINYRLLFYCIG